MSKKEDLTIEQQSEIRFRDDVKCHKATVIRDDNGVNRHVRYQRPGSWAYGFDIITWPGHLCITGDCGTYVFQRVYDMFNFFTSESKQYPINTGYWSEKLLSADIKGGVKQFSEKAFSDAVHYNFVKFAKDDCGRHTPEQIRELWADIKEIMRSEGEHESVRSVMEYERHGFSFEEFWEHNLTEYTFRFMWNLNAIVWGIKKYNKLEMEGQNQ